MQEAGALSPSFTEEDLLRDELGQQRLHGGDQSHHTTIADQCGGGLFNTEHPPWFTFRSRRRAVSWVQTETSGGHEWDGQTFEQKGTVSRRGFATRLDSGVGLTDSY